MIKIKKITLNGFRGVKNTLSFNLEKGSSLLIYGDNGTGKSSITDAFEWTFFDAVGLLKGEEIPKNEGLRNKDISSCAVSLNIY